MKKSRLFPIKNMFFRFRVRTLTNPSHLRICAIFLLYCTAVSFLLMGVHLFYEEQMVEKNIQRRIARAASENFSSRSVLYLNERQTLQKGIAHQVIRLHVIANSDSTEDQKLKLQVRDQIISDLQNSLRTIESQKKAEEVVASKIGELEKTASSVIHREGFSYPVTVSLNSEPFPVKQYGDLTFPAGIYRALCIRIGKADGHNWWCVLFPSLCLVDETTADVPAESKAKLKKSLTKEEYQLLTQPPEPHSLFFDYFTGK